MTLRLALPVLVLLLFTPAPAAEPVDPGEDRARIAFADGDYATGVGLYRALLAERPDGPRADAWAMMVVRGLSLAGDNAATAEAGRAFPDRFPASRFREKVAFLTARALLAGGEGETASGMLARAVERLGGAARVELATRLIAEGNRALAGQPAKGPFDEAEEPDPDRALDLFHLALRIGVPEAERDAVRLLAATAAVNAEQYEEATKLLDTLKASPRARLLRARALAGQDRRREARAEIDELLAVAPASPEAAGALLLLDDPEHLDRLVREFATHRSAPGAALRHARILADRDEVEASVLAFDDVRARFPRSAQAPFAAAAAAELLIEAGAFPEARQRIATLHGDDPPAARWAKLSESLETEWVERGRGLLQEEDVDGAGALWARFREELPSSPLVPVTLLEEAAARPPEVALGLLVRIVERHGESEAAPGAALAAAGILETMPGRAAEAVTALRRIVETCPDSAEAEEAEERLEGMRDEHLEVILPAPRRPGERATVVVRTRNVDRLVGRVHRLDAVDYFRKHGGFRGLGDVMAEVIEPDARFEHRIADYEPLRRIETEVEIPVSGEGAWLVVLESDSLQAVGLLLVSDLTLITKSSPRSVLAFVQTARDGRPAPGVRVLVRSDAGEVREVVTGPDGVALLRGTHDRRRPVGILAVRGDSVAHDDLCRPWWRVRSLGRTVHIATDRPIYRPGHRVRFRAVARRGRGDRYETPAGAPVRFTLTDRAGNRLLDRLATLSEFGTASDEFDLPVDLPPGRYQIVAEFDETTHEGAFRVEAYRKPGLLLDIRTARGDVVRGEDVVLDLAARQVFGPAAAGLAVRVRARAPAGRREFETLLDETVTTDADGRARVVLPTRPGRYDLDLEVRLDARDAAGRATKAEVRIPVPAAAYRASLSTPRSSVIAGEDVRVDVLALDARGEPVSAKGRIEVGRAPSGDGPAVHVGVATRPVETGPDGRAWIVFRADEPGRYRFRYRGVDRAGNPVTATTFVTAGRARDTRLRVRADRPRYDVGDIARVDVKTPATGLHALLTFEGEDIYGYRVVKLDGSPLDIPVTPSFVPDVRLRVTLAFDGHLRAGEDRIFANERIVLTLEPERSEFAPGDVCRVRVRTADPQGAPVAAEVALAVVDEAIFRLHPDETPDLTATFHIPPRGDLVETGSSLDFRHEGDTRELGEDLLAERTRRKTRTEHTGLLLEEESLTEKIRPRPPLSHPATPSPGGYRGPGGEVPAGQRDPRDPPEPADGALPGVRRAFEDTAYWRGDVTTGPDGTAVVEFVLPDDLTAWRITARGATAGNAFGEATGTVRTSRPVAVSVALPRFLRTGDRVEAAAVVINGTGEPIETHVRLTPGDGGAKKLSVPPGHALPVAWPLRGDVPGEVTVSARVEVDGELADGEERVLRTRHAGVPFRTGATAVAAKPGAWIVEEPGDAIAETLRLDLHVAPSLRDAALAAVRKVANGPYHCVEQTAHRVLPALAALDLLRESGAPDVKRLRAVVRAGAIRLAYLQNPEGLWGWWAGDETDPEMTAFALLALGGAKRAGTPVSDATLEKAEKAVGALLRRTVDPGVRAFVLLGWTRALGPDVRVLGAAFADRRRLDARGLAHLALAYEGVPAGEGPLRILLRELDGRARESNDVETLGWVLAALAGPESLPPVAARELALRVAARREGSGFRTTRETGAAVFGLARAARSGAPTTTPARLRVEIDGETVLERVLEAGHGTRSFSLPVERLRPGRNRITVSGATGLFPSLVLRGVRRETPPDVEGLAVSRRFSLLPRIDPKEGAHEPLVREGGEAREPDLHALRAGEAVRVTLRVANRARVRFLVVEDPIPAGFEPVLDTAEGPFSECVRHEDRLVFFVTDATAEIVLTYGIYAERPGVVGVPPAMAYAMYRPRLAAWSTPGTLQTVAADATVPRDPTVGLDARGLLRAARRARAEGRPGDAVRFLETVLDRYDLLGPVRARARHTLAETRFAAGDYRGTVDEYERLLVENPTVALEVVDEVRRGTACRALDRHGEAVDAFERAAAGLREEDEYAVSLLEDREAAALEATILDRYPFSDALEAAWAERARRSADGFEADLERGETVDPGRLDDLREFRARYPRSAAAPEISLRLARAWLRARRFEDAEWEARRLARVDGDGPLADDADWFIAHALFARGRIEEAEKAARASLARTYSLGKDRTGPSSYGRNLVHLLAQAAHVGGRLEEALARYREVAEYSVDAREAVRDLTEPSLAVSEVVRVRRTQTPVVTVTARNLAEVRLDLYPIDILVYFALSKDVEWVAGLNLDGIPAAERRTVPIPGFSDRAAHRMRVPVEGLEAGVYLAVARAEGGPERSGVVIVSDIEARVRSHEHGARVIVTDGVTGEAVPGAYVKVAENGRIVGDGWTDARGVVDVEGDFRGGASAVVRKGRDCALAAE